MRKKLTRAFARLLVKNVSDKNLTEAETSVLKKGLNFAVTPQTTPVVDLVTVTETACRYLDKNNADVLRSEAVSVLKRQKKQ